jgi:ribose transport system permease protein
MAYVWAQLLYAVAGIMIAGIITVSNAFMGDPYLLPSVAVVVLGGTSLLGGRGLPTATVVAAVFLSQLDQFVLALGVNFAIRTLVQAAALGIGVAIYTVDWARVRAALNRLLSTSSRGQNQTSLPSA